MKNLLVKLLGNHNQLCIAKCEDGYIVTLSTCIYTVSAIAPTIKKALRLLVEKIDV